MSKVSSISDVFVDAVRNSKILYVKNKLSAKPQKSINALQKYIRAKNAGPIIYMYPRMELRQNYSNNTVEMARMYFDYDCLTFKQYIKTDIPANSSADKYIKAFDRLAKYEKPKIKKTFRGEIKKFFKFILGKE